MDEKHMKERIARLEDAIRKASALMIATSKSLHPAGNRMVGLANIARKASDDLAIGAEALRDAL